MLFKSKGANWSPLSGITDWKSSVFNPSVDIQQTKNAVGGAGFATDAYVKAKDAAAIAAATAAANPVSSMASADAQSLQAEQDVRRNALKNMGYLKTIYAGETGGWKK